MKRNVTLREFCSTMVMGLWQAFCYVCKAFDPRHKTRFWRVIWAVWTVVLLSIVALLAYAFWRTELRSSCRVCDRDWLSNNVYYQTVDHGDDFLYNVKTGKRTLTGLYYHAMPEGNDSLGVFFKNGKRGYFNINTGEQVLPADYDQAWVFSDGVAMAVKDGSLQLINGEGKVKATFWYSRRRQDCNNTEYIFRDGRCVVDVENGNVGLINTAGEWVMPAVYKTIQHVELGGKVVYHVSKKDSVSGRALHGVFDSDGNGVVPCIYRTLRILDGSGIFVSDAQHYQWRIDMDGNLTDEPLCYNVSRLEYAVKTQNKDDESEWGEGYVTEMRDAPLYSYTSSSEEYKGLMDAKGHRITPPIYGEIKAINDDLYCCSYDCQYDHAVLLNAKGEVVK